MRLPTKTTLALGIVLAVSTLLHVVLFRAFIFRSFVRLEAEEARRAMRRCMAALEREIDHLRMITTDWAQWDDTYGFAQDRNEEYIRVNLGPDTFVNNRLSLIACYNEQGVLLWGRTYRADAEAESGLGLLAGPLSADHPLMALATATNTAGGIFLSECGPMLVASSPILTSEGRGPSRGRLVMGRVFDDAEVQRLGQQVGVELDVQTLGGGGLLPETGRQKGLERLSADGTPAIFEKSRDSLLVGAVQADLYGKPALLLRITLPRDISARATSTLYYVTVAVAMVGVVILLDILLVLRWLVLAPMTTLTHNILEIRKAGALVRPVALEGDDELAVLSREFEKTVAELAEAKAHAERATRAKSDFLNVVSHELRTPLGAIVSLADLIAASPDHERCREWARRIAHESDALQGLLNELLDIGRAEAGKLSIEEVVFNPRAFLEDLEQTLAARAQQKGLTFELWRDPRMPPALVGDPRRIRQVLMNLADNAMKFTQRGSVRIAVTILEETPEGVLVGFSVADTGMGIPRSKQSVVFDEFVQVYDEMARQYGGSGLGTAISRQLVRRMGGDMGLESEEGKGSTFWFTLRLKRAAP